MGFNYGTVNVEVYLTNLINICILAFFSFLLSSVLFIFSNKLKSFQKILLQHLITYVGILFQFVFIDFFRINIHSLGFTSVPLFIEKIFFFILHTLVTYLLTYFWLFLSWKVLKKRSEVFTLTYWLFQIIIVLVIVVVSLINLMPSFFNINEDYNKLDFLTLIF